MTEEYTYKNGDFIPVKRSALLNAVGDGVRSPLARVAFNGAIIGAIIFIGVKLFKTS